MSSTFNLRVVLWVLLLATLFYNYQQWLHDYPPPAAAPTAQTTAGTAASGTPHTGSSLDAVPTLAAPAPAAPSTAGTSPGGTAGAPASTSGTALAGNPAVTGAAAPAAGHVHVLTDVLDLDVSLAGGELSRADLLAYHEHKGDTAPIRLLNRDSDQSLYVLQSGLQSTAGAPAPSFQSLYTSATTELTLAPGQDELKLPLTWTDGHGLTVTKTYTFKRGQYAIGLEYQIRNDTGQAWSFAPYSQIRRYNVPVQTSYMHPDSYAFKGPAYYDGSKYEKLRVDKGPVKFDRQDVKGGWIAGLQHHFTAAIVPDGKSPEHFELVTEGITYLLKATGPTQGVAPGATATSTATLFVGPKLHDQLAAAAPELDRVADYGALTFLARPLFTLLKYIHMVLGNWGGTIIIATLLLKLLFYPLSEASGRSMAKMKTLQPRIKQLQETYKDERDKLGRAMMDLYKKEKVNPVAGCLPMIIQIPVFLAFYWVLLESVEMRQAPFLGWIHDLSVRDPLFILPVIMAGAMFAQYKLNPTPPDPVQAKLFMIMPFAMSAMFAFFPAGLVLYWVTNTLLSILQQWNINRRIGAAKAAK